VSDRAEGAKARAMARRVLLTGVVSTVLALPLAAAPAGAHLRSGTAAVDYRASVIAAETDARSAQIFQSDRALSATVRAGHSAPEQWHVAAAIGLGLVALAVGLLEGASFLHPSSSRPVRQPRPGLPTSWPSVPGVVAAGLGGLGYVEQGGVMPADSTIGAGGRLRGAAVICSAGGIC
jgi:hypothetical protein